MAGRINSCLIPFFLNEWQQLLGWISANIFGVEPIQLGAIKHCVRAGNPVQAEQADELGVPKNFRSAFRRSPAEKGKKIAKSFRNDPFITIRHDAGRTVTFAEPRFIRTKNEWNVRE